MLAAVGSLAWRIAVGQCRLAQGRPGGDAHDTLLTCAFVLFQDSGTSFLHFGGPRFEQHIEV